MLIPNKNHGNFHQDVTLYLDEPTPCRSLSSSQSDATDTGRIATSGATISTVIPRFTEHHARPRRVAIGHITVARRPRRQRNHPHHVLRAQRYLWSRAIPGPPTRPLDERNLITLGVRCDHDRRQRIAPRGFRSENQAISHRIAPNLSGATPSLGSIRVILQTHTVPDRIHPRSHPPRTIAQTRQHCIRHHRPLSFCSVIVHSARFILW